MPPSERARSILRASSLLAYGACLLGPAYTIPALADGAHPAWMVLLLAASAISFVALLAGAGVQFLHMRSRASAAAGTRDAA